jgi:hypothetical protein
MVIVGVIAALTARATSNGSANLYRRDTSCNAN